MTTATPRRKTKVDPFAAVANAEQDVNTNDKETSVDQVNVDVEQGTKELTLTFKAGTGFDAPWIVVRVPNLETANRILTDEAELLKEVMEKTARAGIFFASQAPSGGSNSGSGGSGNGGGRPARQEAPGGQGRTCKHGDMVYRSGSKNGRAWEAFFCPTPQGTADQCKPAFI